MEQISSNTATNNQSTPVERSLISRFKHMNRLFVITVIVPTIIAVVYYGLIASDVYVSESRFIVRSASRQSSSSVVGALLQGAAFSRTPDDAYSVIDYIQSRDALHELNTNSGIATAYSTQGDIFSRFHASLDGSFESLWRYYGKHIVSVNLDSASGIATLQVRAYTANEAAGINEKLLEISERLINEMNKRAADDTVRFAQHQVDEAAERAKAAAVNLAAYRNGNSVFDPEKQSALQLQQITKLQTELFSAQTQLVQLQSIAPKNPQIPVLTQNIAMLQKQIHDSTGDVTGSKGSLSAKNVAYTKLQLDSEVANKQLASTISALENARSEAERKQLYLARLIQPNTPDVATEPKRLRSIFEAIALGVIAWGILSLLLAGIREHHD
ncbi:hypothetical protein [Burkholderia cenocepacia]|uniref:hypothetical protein n=1 Tax=Burkholderia cenocepacia TaxID=95486 RepID=UPI0035BBAEB0